MSNLKNHKDVASGSVIKHSPSGRQKKKPSAATAAASLGTLASLRQGHQGELCVLKATAFGFRDASSKFPGRFAPEDDGFIAVHQRLIGRIAVGGTASELRRLGDKSLVLVAPADDDFVFLQAINRVDKKRTMLVRNWKAALNQFVIRFGDRVPV